MANGKIAFAMVGLPARGKTYMARKIARYLAWLGHDTRVFNVGSYRRNRIGARQTHEFFDPENPSGAEARRQLALAALDDMLGWLRAGGEVCELEEGVPIVFDDSFEHDAWNDGDSTRIIVLLDVWHPQLTAVERSVLGAISREFYAAVVSAPADTSIVGAKA